MSAGKSSEVPYKLGTETGLYFFLCGTFGTVCGLELILSLPDACNARLARPVLAEEAERRGDPCFRGELSTYTHNLCLGGFLPKDPSGGTIDLDLGMSGVYRHLWLCRVTVGTIYGWRLVIGANGVDGVHVAGSF